MNKVGVFDSSKCLIVCQELTEELKLIVKMSQYHAQLLTEQGNRTHQTQSCNNIVMTSSLAIKSTTPMFNFISDFNVVVLLGTRWTDGCP
jgi:hypothetical protein